MKAIQITSTGGPEVLEYRTVPDPIPKSGEVLILVHTAGVNFIDVYYRDGHYKAPLPLIPVGRNRDTLQPLEKAFPDSRWATPSRGLVLWAAMPRKPLFPPTRSYGFPQAWPWKLQRPSWCKEQQHIASATSLTLLNLAIRLLFMQPREVSAFF